MADQLTILQDVELILTYEWRSSAMGEAEVKRKQDNHDRFLIQLYHERAVANAERKDQRRRRYIKRMRAINPEWGLRNYDV